MGDERRKARVTMRDVAAVAEVALATVSKSLNGSKEVSEATRARVVEAANRLGYRPNRIAQGLRARRTQTLGLVTDDIEGLFTTTMLRGVEEVASAHGFGVFLCNSYGRRGKEHDHLQMLVDKQVDGVVLLSGYRVRERAAPAFDLSGVPAVYLFQYTHDLAVPCVLPDDYGGATLGVQHLLDAGSRVIGFINGPRHYEVTRDRLAGYRDSLRLAGYGFDPGLVREATTWHEDQGYAQAHDLLDAHPEVDALFCASDNLAVGALDALHQRGVDVPGQLLLAGFDDRPLAKHQRPPLSSVALPLIDMGREASRLLIQAIEGVPQQHTLLKMPCRLVVRDSSRRPTAPMPG